MIYTWINKNKYPFDEGSFDCLHIKDFMWPSDWMEEHFRLTRTHATKGKIRLFNWQSFPLNIMIFFEGVTYIGPTQTGKSLLGEGAIAYKIDNDNNNILFVYAKKETVQDVLDERIKPIIMEIPAMRKYWSGYEEDLTKRRIKLNHLVCRVASAGVKTEIATFNAGIVYGSELAKWPVKDFDQFVAIEGRKQASRMIGKKTLTLYETSPEHDQDPSYMIAHRPSTIFFRPIYPCPNCEKYILLSDRKVKEIPNKEGEKDHNPERIRNDKAAYLECDNCGHHIVDNDRLKMSKGLKWASVSLKDKDHIIKIYGQDGKDLKDIKFRARYAVCQWNRLCDDTWSFYECLASYFEALNSPRPEALKTYRNENMAEWVKLRAKKFEDSFLRSKCQKYKQFGADAYVPDGVSILLLAADTQDNGFYYTVRGYGQNLESWLVRADFIVCDMKDFSNPADVFERFIGEIHRYPYHKKSGQKVPIFFGLIDRGGHRAKDVDYIVQHSQNIGAYIGSTHKDAQLIELKKSGYYYGQTEKLSRIVQKNMESDIWHLPIDISKDYSQQVLNQYDEEFTDTRGNKKKKWICKEPDHFRDTENYLAGLVIMLDLHSQLFDEMYVDDMEKAIIEKDEESAKEIDKTESIMPGFEKEMDSYGW